MPKVSIIVPNYNHARYLPQRFESIFNQTYQDFEVIILDDCSTDNSREIIEEYRNHPKVSHIVYNTENGGTSYKQWYKGIELAKGELIWIAESDDWCDLRFLETLVPYLSDWQVSLVFSESEYLYEGATYNHIETISGKHFIHNGDNFIKTEMLIGNRIYNASMVLFRRNKYMEVKDCGYSDMNLCGDWLLWFWIVNNNKVIHIPEKLNILRRHSTNATNKYRAQGLDFIEGLIIYNLGKSLFKNVNKIDVYKGWLNRYYAYKEHFKVRVYLKVQLKILTVDAGMFYFINRKAIKAKVKSYLFTRNMLKLNE